MDLGICWSPNLSVLPNPRLKCSKSKYLGLASSLHCGALLVHSSAPTSRWANWWNNFGLENTLEPNMVATLAGLELDLNKLSKQVREYVAMCGSQRGKSAQELREMKDLVSLRQKLSKVTRVTRSLHPSVVTLCAVKFVQTVGVFNLSLENWITIYQVHVCNKG